MDKIFVLFSPGVTESTLAALGLVEALDGLPCHVDILLITIWAMRSPGEMV